MVSQELKRRAKRAGLRLTRKRNGVRKPKSSAMLAAELARHNKIGMRRRRRRRRRARVGVAGSRSLVRRSRVSKTEGRLSRALFDLLQRLGVIGTPIFGDRR